MGYKLLRATAVQPTCSSALVAPCTPGPAPSFSPSRLLPRHRHFRPRQAQPQPQPAHSGPRPCSPKKGFCTPPVRGLVPTPCPRTDSLPPVRGLVPTPLFAD